MTDTGHDRVSGPTPGPVGRRCLLQTGAAALGGLAVGVTAVRPSAAQTSATSTSGPDSSTDPLDQREPFFGEHQAGIDTVPPMYAALIGLDLVDRTSADNLRRLMFLLSDDAARLCEGVPALADTEPELAGQPARLTVTFGFSPAVLEMLGVRREIGISQLPAFSVDRLQDRWGQSDVIIQVRAEDQITLAHARRVLIKDTRTLAKVRWIQQGFRGGPVTPAGTGRNLMGQVDGTINPAFGSDDFARQVWIPEGPAAGGTMMVVRRIEMLLNLWDKVDRRGREFTIGRDLTNGAPLTGGGELDPIDFEATDDLGFPVIDLAAHVRRAHATNSVERFLRAPYNYVHDRDDGSTESGLLFIAFQADIETQFVPVQKRIAESDRLNTWVRPIGSAVYLMPPGCQEGSFVGAELIGTT